MKERPILFSAPMVRALLDGSKTQTRRVVKDLPPWEITEIVPSASGCGRWLPNGPAPSGRGMASGHWRPCPYGQPGDRLWVREAWKTYSAYDQQNATEMQERLACSTAEMANIVPIEYAADGTQRTWCAAAAKPGRQRHARFMPRWASRILLEVVSVRVERLSAISAADCHAEGIGQCDGLGSNAEILDLARRMGTFSDETLRYATLWEQINGAGSWDTNPWVWVVEFKRVAS